MAAKLKMPVSTLRYFASQHYQGFQMRGVCKPQTHKTMHVNDAGERVELTTVIFPQERKAVCEWATNERDAAGNRTIERREMVIRQSWGIGF